MFGGQTGFFIPQQEILHDGQNHHGGYMQQQPGGIMGGYRSGAYGGGMQVQGGFPNSGNFADQNNAYLNQNMNMQGMGGFAPGMNQQQNQVAQERRKAKVFTPVTVKMVANSQPRPDDVCEYDGDPINDIILCGRILRRIEEPMRTQFEINDNTGTFYVLFYHKGENQVPTALRNFHYEQFTYVKVYGNIRVFKEEKAIVGTHIKRITKFDELTNHFLSVYTSHCIRKKGILSQQQLQQYKMDQNKQMMMQNLNNNLSNSRSNITNENSMSHIQADMNPNSSHSGNYRQIGSQNMNFNLRKAILELMKQMTKTQKFVNKQQLFDLIKDKIDGQRHVYEKELEYMMNDGEISSAFDTNHLCLNS